MLDKRDKVIVCEINPANQVHRAFDNDTKRFWRSVKLLPTLELTCQTNGGRSKLISSFV